MTEIERAHKIGIYLKLSKLKKLTELILNLQRLQDLVSFQKVLTLWTSTK